MLKRLSLVALIFSTPSLYAQSGNVEFTLSALSYNSSSEKHKPDEDGVEDYKRTSESLNSSPWDLEIALNKDAFTLYLYPSIPITGFGIFGAVGFGFRALSFLEVGVLGSYSQSKDENKKKGDEEEDKEDYTAFSIFAKYTLDLGMMGLEINPKIISSSLKQEHTYSYSVSEGESKSKEETKGFAYGLKVLAFVPIVPDKWFYEGYVEFTMAEDVEKKTDSDIDEDETTTEKSKEKISRTSFHIVPLAVRFRI